jgi:neutral ceramidase
MYNFKPKNVKVMAIEKHNGTSNPAACLHRLYTSSKPVVPGPGRTLLEKLTCMGVAGYFIGCCLALLVGLQVSLQAQTRAATGAAKVFRAGAATSNVTPPLGEGIVGNFGTPPPAEHIHDQLHARCLALDDGETRLVIVAVDNVGINREVFDEAKRLIHEATGLPKAHMLMSATHTHSATSASGLGTNRRGWKYGQPLDEYQTFVARRIADGVRTALNNLQPARIGWGVGKVPQHVFNRRWKMKPGTPLVNPFGGQDQVLMNPGIANPNLLEPAGPTDPEVSFLSVQSAQGRPIALLGNYSLHYVGGVPKNDISADYFAVFADRIQELLQADRQEPPFRREQHQLPGASGKTSPLCQNAPGSRGRGPGSFPGV